MSPSASHHLSAVFLRFSRCTVSIASVKSFLMKPFMRLSTQFFVTYRDNWVCAPGYDSPLAICVTLMYCTT